MTKDEKIQWLLQHAPGPYAKARAEVEQKLDEQTPIFCFCGKLATGFHTCRCKKFQDRMKSLIIEKFHNMLPK